MAVNQTEEDARLRIYFWDYYGEIVDGKQISEEINAWYKSTKSGK